MKSEDEQEQPAVIQDATYLLQIGNVIQYKPKNEDLWQTEKDLSRADKSTVKHSSWFNIEDFVTKKISSIDLRMILMCGKY